MFTTQTAQYDPTGTLLFTSQQSLARKFAKKNSYEKTHKNWSG